MSYETLLVKKSVGSITVTVNRVEVRNSLNNRLLEELNDVMDQAVEDPESRLLVLEGQQGVFCTGMDFQEVDAIESELYMETIKRFSLIPRVVVSVVDGQVLAGGVGLAAASDLVIATPRSQFGLSEALWGMLPSMVIPYLIRRVGYQRAYRMTLTTLPISAREAFQANLVDEICDNPQDILRRLLLRFMRLESTTIANMKQYFRKMWIITEDMEQQAVSETSRLIAEPDVRENIENFVKYKKFPWEK